MKFSKGGSLTVMRSGALGDFVLTLPVLAALRAAFPSAALRLIGAPQLVWMTRPDAVLDHDSPGLIPLYSGAPLPPDTDPFFKDCALFLAYAADADGSLGSRLRQVAGGEVVVHSPHPPAGVHIADHLLAPLRRLGIAAPEPLPRLELRDAERAYARCCWRERRLQPPVALIHPGSGGRRKCWPLPRFVELARRLRQRAIAVLLLLGPAEEDLAEWVRADPHCRQLAVVPPGLPELAGLLERADLFIGNDSGPGHLAAALGTPALSLFGPTDPLVWRPRQPHSRVIQAPQGQLETLEVEAVEQAALEILLTR